MCRAGFLVLDVFPITDSYPQGTGTHGAHGPVKNDIVHYSNLAFIPAEELLEEYFGGKLPWKLLERTQINSTEGIQ